MLLAYYSSGYDSKNIFSKLKISEDPTYEKYLNKFDVIYLDLVDIDRKAAVSNLNIKDFIDRSNLIDSYNKYLNSKGEV